MKKLNFQGITSGLNDLSTATDSNSKAGYNETIDVTLIDLAPKNNYATDDNEDAYLSLAASIESAGLLTPLGVIKNGNRYTLFSGERRFRAITQYLHWPSVSCYVFEGVSPLRAEFMLHQANAAREYTPQRKLQLYEEYIDLLSRMKAAGEFKGGMQKQLATLLGVSERSIRYYKQMSEKLTDREKTQIADGCLDIKTARRIAVGRNEKNGNIAAFRPDTPSPLGTFKDTSEKTGNIAAFELDTPPLLDASEDTPEKTGNIAAFEPGTPPPLDASEDTPEKTGNIAAFGSHEHEDELKRAVLHILNLLNEIPEESSKRFIQHYFRRYLE